MERCKDLTTDDNVRARTRPRALLVLWRQIELVGEAAYGQEALQMVRERQPDVVSMDTRLPGMNRVEATRRIKGLCCRCRRIPEKGMSDRRIAGSSPRR